MGILKVLESRRQHGPNSVGGYNRLCLSRTPLLLAGETCAANSTTPASPRAAT